MGRADNPYSVVDSQLRVYGIQYLRVMDASVMPVVPVGNTNSPTIVIAEKVYLLHCKMFPYINLYYIFSLISTFRELT